MRLRSDQVNVVGCSLLLGFAAACAQASKSASSGASQASGSEQAGSPSSPSVSSSTGSGTSAVVPANVAENLPASLLGTSSCSPTFLVPSTSNPFLAGVAVGTKIDYSTTLSPAPADPTPFIDDAPDESPVVANITSAPCLVPGKTLTFTVTGGQSSVGTGFSAFDSNGDATSIVNHLFGSYLGKSDIKAPVNSLVAVFLSSADPSPGTPPATLDFSTQAARDYTALAPKLAQIFFIGTGLTSSGAAHQVMVPAGATRLFFADMDAYQWNNNVGSMSISMQGLGK